LNIGNKPTESSLSFGLAQCLQKHLHTDIPIGHSKPTASNKFLSDCREYIFHFTNGNVKMDKKGIGVLHQDKTNIGSWNLRSQIRVTEVMRGLFLVK